MTWLAPVVVVPATISPVIGAWNPWNLVVVDRVLYHPALAGLVVAGVLCGLCHLWVREWILRIALFPAIGFVGAVWALGWLMLGSIQAVPVRGAIESPFNDVEVRFRVNETGSASFVWLRAERGLLSRENEIGAVGSSGSGAPPLDARFTAPDRLVVTHAGETIYSVRFDPHDLELRETHCGTIESPLASTVTSCLR